MFVLFTSSPTLPSFQLIWSHFFSAAKELPLGRSLGTQSLLEVWNSRSTWSRLSGRSRQNHRLLQHSSASSSSVFSPSPPRFKLSIASSNRGQSCSCPCESPLVDSHLLLFRSPRLSLLLLRRTWHLFETDVPISTRVLLLLRILSSNSRAMRGFLDAKFEESVDVDLKCVAFLLSQPSSFPSISRATAESYFFILDAQISRPSSSS